MSKIDNPYFQSGLMMFASSLNIIGSSVAVHNGSASQNAFFYFSFSTSILYAIANGIKTAQIYSETRKTFVERLEAEKELREIVISK